MPVYSYTAFDRSGRKVRGRMDASSEAVLEGLLEKQGQWLAEVKSQAKTLAAPRSADTGRADKSARVKAPRRQIIEFFLQMHLQLKAGIPILAALEFGAAESGHAGLRQVLREVLEKVEAGESLSDAMASYRRIFPPLTINLIRAGETSGRLAETCEELRQYYEWLDRLFSDIRQALIYPCFVLLATAGFVLLLFTFLIPRFAVLLEELNVPLPMVTQVMMGLSDFTLAYWPWLLLGPPSLLAVAGMARRGSPRLALLADRVRLELPWLGSLYRLICLSRFAHNLAVLYRAGVPLLEGLVLSRDLVGNQVLSQAIGRVESGVNEGAHLHEVMAREEVFSALILQMVQVGETTGNLGESLENVAEYYNQVIPRRIKKMFTIMEPAMILILIGVVGLVALSIFLPIANLLGAG